MTPKAVMAELFTADWPGRLPNCSTSVPPTSTMMMPSKEPSRSSGGANCVTPRTMMPVTYPSSTAGRWPLRDVAA